MRRPKLEPPNEDQLNALVWKRLWNSHHGTASDEEQAERDRALWVHLSTEDQTHE